MSNIRVTLDKAHDRRCREDNTQTGIVEIAIAQFFRPVGVLKRMINEQRLTALLNKLTGKLVEGMLGKIEVVKVDVKYLAPPFGIAVG